MQASHLPGEPHLFGWYVGFAVAFAVIVVVVILVAAILTLAKRIGEQAQMAIGALDDCRVSTLPLWDVSKVNDSVNSIVGGLRKARAALGG